MQKNSKLKGFTLTEVICSFLVIVIVSAMLYAGIITAANILKKASDVRQSSFLSAGNLENKIADNSYQNASTDIICKIYDSEDIPVMTIYERAVLIIADDENYEFRYWKPEAEYD